MTSLEMAEILGKLESPDSNLVAGLHTQNK